MSKVNIKVYKYTLKSGKKGYQYETIETVGKSVCSVFTIKDIVTSIKECYILSENLLELSIDFKTNHDIVYYNKDFIMLYNDFSEQEIKEFWDYFIQ